MTNLSNVSYDDYLEFEGTLMHYGVLAAHNARKNYKANKKTQRST